MVATTSLNLDQARELVEVCINARKPLFLHSAPGIGKSETVRAVAKSRGWRIIDLRMSLLQPSDLRGIPVVSEDRKTVRWAPPEFLPREGEGILFLDELNLAVPTVQSAAMQLVLDRQVGEYKLPDGWHIIAAGNRAKDRTAVFEMSSALRNRFVHCEIEVSHPVWEKWAIANDVHPLVVSYLHQYPQYLMEMPKNPSESSFPTPRSWVYLSDMLKSKLSVADASFAAGVIGHGHAVQFITYCKLAEQLPHAQDILEGKASPNKPRSQDQVYLLVSTLAHAVKEAQPKKQTSYAVNAIRYIHDKMDEEHMAYFITSTITKISNEARQKVAETCRDCWGNLSDLLKS